MLMKRIQKPSTEGVVVQSGGQAINVKPYPDTATKYFLQKKGKSNLVGRGWMRVANHGAIYGNEGMSGQAMTRASDETNTGRLDWTRRTTAR
jgi:hypothetical protein